MGALFRFLILLIIITPLIAIGVAWMALSDRPLITTKTTLSHEDIARARNIIKENDPRHMAAGSRQTISLNDQDLNLAGTYALRQAASGKIKINTRHRQLTLKGTIRNRKLPKQYINFIVKIDEQVGLPSLHSVQVGSVTIPPFIAMLALDYIIEEKKLEKEYQLLKQTIERVEMEQTLVKLTYQWDPDVAKQARNSLVQRSTNSEALVSYHRQLTRITRNNRLRHTSIKDVLMPLFRIAQSRSQFSDPIEENKALLTLLGTWAANGDLETLAPNSKRHPGEFSQTLNRRGDLARHFIISATIAARSGNAISDAIGLQKELDDSKNGSGFSFHDIAADRAGSRFGRQAIESAASATRLQNVLANGLPEEGFMPEISDLPEGLTQFEFDRSYGGINSPSYKRMIDDIDRRVENLTIYSQL